MKYIITGATSFIGVQLCEYLLGCSHDIVAVCRKGSRKVDLLPKKGNLSVVYADMKEYRLLPSEIKEADIFINLAWDATTHEGREQNVEYSLDAVMAARQMGCKLFAEAGSQAEYGITKERQNDRTLCYPVTEYGRAKLTLNNMASEYCLMTKMKYLHLRIFSTYGENDRPYTLISTCIEKMLKDEPIDLSSCKQNWNFLYVKDAAKQIGMLSEYAYNDEKYRYEIFPIGSEDTRSLQYFVKEIKEITGSKSQLNFGSVEPKYVVSLQPEMTKTKSAIGFISDYSFSDGIKEILGKC